MVMENKLKKSIFCRDVCRFLVARETVKIFFTIYITFQNEIASIQEINFTQLFNNIRQHLKYYEI